MHQQTLLGATRLYQDLPVDYLLEKTTQIDFHLTMLEFIEIVQDPPLCHRRYQLQPGQMKKDSIKCTENSQEQLASTRIFQQTISEKGIQKKLYLTMLEFFRIGKHPPLCHRRYKLALVQTRTDYIKCIKRHSQELLASTRLLKQTNSKKKQTQQDSYLTMLEFMEVGQDPLLCHSRYQLPLQQTKKVFITSIKRHSQEPLAPTRTLQQPSFQNMDPERHFPFVKCHVPLGRKMLKFIAIVQNPLPCHRRQQPPLV